MDVFDFYSSVVLKEIKLFNVTSERFKQSLAAISTAYSPESLKNGETFLDYNIPSHRCAYLYKFGPCHTELLYIYFRIFLQSAPEVYSTLKQKNELKICCLGGGAGTDAVGVLRALVSYKYLQKKVSEINVLDICGGWRNSFKKIIQKLKDEGKVSNAFLDQAKLDTKLTAVDLTETPSDSVLQVIKEADIICMVKFVSAVISKPSAEEAFKNLASHMKYGAAVIFIDNFSNRVYDPINTILCQAGLRCVFGPHHARFRMKGSFPSKFTYSPARLRLKSTAVSVVGWIKSSLVSVPFADVQNFPSVPQNTLSIDGTICTEDEDLNAFGNASNSDYGHYQLIEGSGDDEDDDFSSEESPSSTDEINSYSDQSTQTVERPNASFWHMKDTNFASLENQLSLLASRLNNLESVVKNVVARNKNKCCHTMLRNCCDTSDRSFSSCTQQDNADCSCSSKTCSLDSHVCHSDYPQNHRCRGAGVQNAPFLVVPTGNILHSEQYSVLLPFLLSGHAAN